MAEKYQCHGITRSGSRCKRRADNKGFCSAHPTPNGLVTKTGFAKLQGFDPSYVSVLLRKGTIREVDGFIPWETSEKAIASSRDLSQPLRRHGDIHDDSVAGEDLEDLGVAEVKRRYSIAQMREREEKAALAEIERLEAEGRLIPLEDVEYDAANVAAKLRASLMAIPDRVAPDVAGLSDTREIHTHLSREIRRVLEGLASEFVQ